MQFPDHSHLALFNTGMAKCLVEGDFLSRFIGSSDQTLWVDPHLAPFAKVLSGIDRRRVQALAGFITKVQNNHTYAIIPISRQLLTKYGCERQLFIEFHQAHQQLRRRSHLNRNARSAVFLRFCIQHVARCSEPQRTMLRTMLQHETYIWQTFQRAAKPERRWEDSGLSTKQSDWFDVNVCFNGMVRIGIYDVDPIQSAKDLLADSELSGKIGERCFAVLYWSGQSGVSRIFAIDVLVASLLRMINGARSLRQVVEMTVAAVPSAPLAEVVQLLGSLVDQRLLVSRRGIRENSTC